MKKEEENTCTKELKIMAIAKKTSDTTSAQTKKPAKISETSAKKTTSKSTTSTTPKNMATKNKSNDVVAEVKQLNADQEEVLNYWETNKNPAFYVDYKSLKTDYNIRTDATDISDLIESITTNGVKIPITIDLNDRIIDGYRRYNTLKYLDEKGLLDEKYRQVLVESIDIAEKNIPHYQYITMLRKGINTQEEENAIYEHIRRNPNQTESKVASLFGKSQTMVHMIGSILRESPELSNLVKSKKASQNLATDLVDKTYLEQLPKEEGKDKKSTLSVAADLIEQFYDEKVVNTIDNYKKKNPEKAGLSDEEVLENVVVHPITSKEFNKFLSNQPTQEIPLLTKFKSSPTATKSTTSSTAITEETGEENKAKAIEFDLKGYGNTIASALPSLLTSTFTVTEDDLVTVTVNPEIIAVLCLKMNVEIPEVVQSLLKPKAKKEAATQFKPKSENAEENSALIDYANELKSTSGTPIEDEMIDPEVYEDVNAVVPLLTTIPNIQTDFSDFDAEEEIQIANPVQPIVPVSAQRNPFSMSKTQLVADEEETGYDFTDTNELNF